MLPAALITISVLDFSHQPRSGGCRNGKYGRVQGASNATRPTTSESRLQMGRHEGACRTLSDLLFSILSNGDSVDIQQRRHLTAVQVELLNVSWLV